MERHGDASSHVYSLPSSRLRGASASSSSAPMTQSISAGHSPVMEQLPPRPMSAVNRKYNTQHWSLISLKRSNSGLLSLPSTPASEVPPSPPPSGTQSSTTASPYLIATFLHLPTQVIYAWPIALKGAMSGKCFVTQPSDPPADFASFDPNAVLSESIKVLTDVVQAWIKTSHMRESLRRKESRKSKGARKIGESEQDAIWLNDSLGLVELGDATRLGALERSWKDEGETITPPFASPAATRAPQSNAASPTQSQSGFKPPSRPETPRIEVTRPQTTAQTQELANPSGLVVAPSRDEDQQKSAAVEAEISQWMNSASLADFTRARPEVARKSAMSGASSASSSGASSPVQKARKSVTFSEPPVPLSMLGAAAMGGASSSSSQTLPSPHMYKPPFAPDVLDLPPSPDENDGTSAGFALPPSAALRPIITAGLGEPTSPVLQDSGSSNSPRSGGSGGSNRHRSLDMGKTILADSSQSTPALDRTPSPGSPGLSPSRHRKTASKLSQEIANEDSVFDKKRGGSSASSSRTSPTQSFADIKSALKSFKPSLGHKKKVSAT